VTNPLALSESVSVGPSIQNVIVTTKGNPGALAHGAKFVYSKVLKGFAASLPQEAIEALKRNPNVISIERDATISIGGIQSGAPWNLDRIDQRTASLDGLYHYDRTGLGVHAYVIDTGIRSTHADFNGRVSAGQDFTGEGSTEDCQGHGTHVAGILGGTWWGVAKAVTLHSLKVFPNCTGTTETSVIIAAVDWVTGNAERPAVVNMSIEGELSPTLNAAVQTSISSGLTYAVAAGNGAVDACTISPASVPQALTVGSTLISPGTGLDRRDAGTNYGSCIDIFAPGVGVTSAWNTDDTATLTMSGTSMSAPLVAGVVALYLQGKPFALPAEVSDSIKAYSSRSVVTASQGVNCNLLFSGRSLQTGRIPKCPR
jgi:subtilisin family serine protease